ncbi:hypothetical protein [Adonisia turfae]|uniref:Uncharacterized protein n=1 Tax=Adonisia turfae CCMR0081 TaxID=2292702 RepID=A0A6M0RMW6_9CYAN|nr:hypothetical protein [Adonisia turfae]NEZ57516.1 hypothetical protein [Adonisia turfae CCMR0081]
MAIPLTSGNQERLALLFVPSELEAATALLLQDCGDNITEHVKLLERVRFAVLKASGGTLDGLVDAIALAQTDWRDALVGAGFADDPEQHTLWWPGDEAS